MFAEQLPYKQGLAYFGYLAASPLRCCPGHTFVPRLGGRLRIPGACAEKLNSVAGVAGLEDEKGGGLVLCFKISRRMSSYDDLKASKNQGSLI